MATLSDHEEKRTRAAFALISRIPGEDEGCQINFKFYKANRIMYDLNFGWTNLTIRNFVSVTAEFPLEYLNGFKLDGLFMSFEKHLYQLSWEPMERKGIYQLRFYGSEQDFQLTANKESIRRFGSQFKQAWDKALLVE
ncbi:hypothetical protein [Paenibacillus sp. ISL-20]|uniref:hypothetical protein n=1 Tax=Paenibacillus sp. ISL-20 TaxID=2819163 RepID=UPI001BE96989|nr:hypothetical protein [Paenibacillus sp. ISL-20]MBT2762992.1 hypothetical protein [Paenibacillus sp. ISL-20]